MDISIWIAIYVPLLIGFFAQRKREVEKAIMWKIKKRRGAKIMTNEVIKKYIGKVCKISTGTFGINIIGKIIDINENWLEVETKKGKELINADFIQNIKMK